MSITSAKTGSTGLSLALDNNYMEPISSTVVSGSPITFTINSIPQTYKHLQLRIYGGSGNGYSPYMTFNSDIANSYSRHRLSGTGSSVSSSGTASYGGISIGGYAGTLYTNSGACSGSIIDILDYSNSNKNKTTRSLTGWDNNTNGYIDYESGCWYNTNAIETISITMATGTWVNGSRISLYGIKG